MTKEEIVDGLELYTVGRLKKSQVYITVEELQKYIDEIKALEQEPCEDAISRKSAINEWYDFCEYRRDEDDDMEDRLNELPSVQPKAKTGRWIDEKWYGTDLIGVTCSKCGVVESRFSEYCPNCGAEMKGDKDANLV